ncbi:tetratricopeptide repeat protein [Limnospira fusiformis]|uniref:tetratricopeptide repeat protein n=1 Tax=Limnospira fusiformis TaxID=54297 RepID=UPI002AA1B2F2|nr:tetratricopeptide repeat protein [Limnospira fusiformis LS22]
MSAGELLRQANQLKRSGRLDEAIALYHQVIDINPHFAWAYHGLGDTLAKQGSLEQAVTEYQKAIKINPNSAIFYINLSLVFIQQCYLEKAIHYLRKAINIKPNLLYCFYGNYKPLFYNIEPGFFLSENKDFIELTEQPIWVTVPVKPLTSYSINGQSYSERPPTYSQGLIQVEFLDKNKQLIPSPYSGISFSQKVGHFVKIPTSGKHYLSDFKTDSFYTQNGTYYMRLGFRTWYDKNQIVLYSKFNLAFDFIYPLLDESSHTHDNCTTALKCKVDYGNSKRIDEAVGLLQQVNHILPGYYGVYDTLGDIFMAQGDLSGAIRAYRQCCLINYNYSFPYEKFRKMYDVNNLNDWAISEDLLIYILEILPVGSTILELGSGTGTFELSKYYNMVSIEHNQDWLNKCNSHYIYAPLIDDMWYDENVVRRELRNIDYNLILVDGPPQHRRKGLLNYLNLFNWNVPIILDDVNRRCDMNVAIDLAKHLGKIPKIYKNEKSFAVIT